MINKKLVRPSIMSDAFSKTSQILTQILKEIRTAELCFIETPSDPALWLRDRLIGSEVVLFCGAGISIAAPAGAPSFLDLRNSTILCASDILAERGCIPAAYVAIIEQATSTLAELLKFITDDLSPKYANKFLRLLKFNKNSEIMENNLNKIYEMMLFKEKQKRFAFLDKIEINT